MTNIGVRELKNQATEILREVREQGAEYIVTYHGKPVARILPFDAKDRSYKVTASTGNATFDDIWTEWDALAKEIDESWQVYESAVEILLDMRSDRDRVLRGLL